MNTSYLNLIPNQIASLGDLIVSPFVSRYDWKRHIEHSQLPTAIKRVVSTVIKSTRLMRIEKSQVAQELLAHFEDGIQRNKSETELVDDFGDPKVAASLIRNSKLKGRSMFTKIFRGGLWSLLAAIAIYVGLYAYFHAAKPNPSTDYTIELNANIQKTSAADRAWNVYRDVWTKFEFGNEQADSPGQFKEIYYKNRDSNQDGRLMLPTDGAQWDLAVKKLDDSRELLDAFRLGGTRPSFGFELHTDLSQYSAEDIAALFPHYQGRAKDENDFNEVDRTLDRSLVGILLPHIQAMRSAARILHVDTRYALSQGDTERATQDIEAVFGMAHQVTDSQFLICSLVGFAIHNIGCEMVGESLRSPDGHFDREQLARIQTAVGKHSMKEFISFESERLMVKDMIQRLYSDNGKGDGRLTADGMNVYQQFTSSFYTNQPQGTNWVEHIALGLGQPLTLLTAASRKQMSDKADEIQNLIDENFHKPLYTKDVVDVETYKADLDDKFFLIKAFLPATMSLRSAVFRAETEQSAAQIVVAAYLYKMDNGEFPETLGQLVGKYLRSAPIDPFDGQPLRYKRTAEHFVVYSIGGDQFDDGGIPVLVSSYTPTRAATADEIENGNARPQRRGEIRYELNPSVKGDIELWPRAADDE